jgi:hypothetical protein
MCDSNGYKYTRTCPAPNNASMGTFPRSRLFSMQLYSNEEILRLSNCLPHISIQVQKPPERESEANRITIDLFLNRYLPNHTA